MASSMGDRRVERFPASSNLTESKQTAETSLDSARVGEKSKHAGVTTNCTYAHRISHSESDSPDETKPGPDCRHRNGPRRTANNSPDDSEPISVLYQNSTEQICIDIDVVPTATDHAAKSATESERLVSTSRLPVFIILSIVKLVDLSFHGIMFVLLVYAAYLSAIFCQQDFEDELCMKNSSLSPVILAKEEWRMPVRDWSLIFSIFHSAYFLLVTVADIFFFSLYANINKYILTVFPVERGFLIVLLVTDSVVYVFSGNLYLVTQDSIVLALLLVSTLFTMIDTIYVLPQLRYLARLDLVWLRKSGKFFSKWRPLLNFVLVMVITLFNLLHTLKPRPSLEVIPLAVFGFLYSLLILLFFILIFVRKSKLKTFLNNLGEVGVESSVPRDWNEGRCDLVLGILGLASINYFSVAPVARTLNFILQTFVS